MRYSVLWLFLIMAIPAFAADVILVGSGGEEKFSQRFADWGSRLERVLIEELGRDKAEVFLLAPDEGQEATARARKMSLTNIDALFADLAKTHPKDEVLFVYMIGHGSHLRNESKFQIPGDDLRARHFDRLLSQVPASKKVIVNGASASAGWVNILSGPNRIICTANKSTGERNATEFFRSFIAALENGDADQNRDTRISVWEAARQAAALTDEWYENAGFIATEHAILDDNGDQKGSRLYNPRGMRQRGPLDGEIARGTFIRDFIFPESAPKELVERYLNVMSELESFIKQKDASNESTFYAELEKRLIRAARLHQQIKQAADSE